MEAPISTVPLPGGQVICIGSDADTPPQLIQELAAASQPCQAYVADEEGLLVLALFADASFALIRPHEATSQRGTAELLSVSREQLRTNLEALPCSLQLVLRKTTVLGGTDFVQFLPLAPGASEEPLLLRLTLPSSRVFVQRLAWPQGVYSKFGSVHCCPLWLQVVPGTRAAEGGPLVASCDVQLPEAGLTAAPRTGVVRLCVSTFTEKGKDRLSLQAGPCQALLAPNFGPPRGLCCSVTDEPRAPAPLPARIPPLFVASAGGVHCILSHEVVALPLSNVRALTTAPRRSGTGSRGPWNGLACLVLQGDALRIINLWEKEEAERDSWLPEEQHSYRLVASQVDCPWQQLPRSPTLLQAFKPCPGTSCVFLLAGQCGEKLDVALLGLERAAQGFRATRRAGASLQVRLPNGTGGLAQRAPISCTAAWPGLAFPQLCVALPGAVEDKVFLELWQLGSRAPQGAGASSGASSWCLALEGQPGMTPFPSSSWPVDASLLLVEDPEDSAQLVAVTARSNETTQLLRWSRDLQPGLEHGKPTKAGQIPGHSLLLRLFRQEHSTMMAQVSETSLVVFGAPPAWGQGMEQAEWKELHSEQLQPFCSHAASCAGPRGGLWLFTAAGPVVLKKEVGRQGRQIHVEPHGAKALPQQVAALCCVEGLRTRTRPLLAASLWISGEVLVLDAEDLQEICHYHHGLPSRLLSLHPCLDDTPDAVNSKGAWWLLAGSADGHLLLFRFEDGGLLLQQTWRLARKPLRLLSLDGGVAVRVDQPRGLHSGAEGFLLRPPAWEPESLLSSQLGPVCSFSETSLLALVHGESGECCGPVEAKLTKEGRRHSVLRSASVHGEVLALSFMRAPEPCILALLQRRASGGKRLCLASFGPELDLLAAVHLEEDRQLWPLGRPSAWLWDLGEGSVLVALGQPGPGSTPIVLHRVELAPRADFEWLGIPGLSKPPAGKVCCSFRLTAAVLVAAEPDSPVVLLSEDGLQFLCQNSLVDLGKLKLADLGLGKRGTAAALGLTTGRPRSWAAIADAAAGPSRFLFLGFTTGAPAVLQMRLCEDEAPTCSLLRLVTSEQPRPPIVHAVGFEDPSSESPCGFLAFDAAGAAFRFRLRFAGGPLEAPCVDVERCESEALPLTANSSWSLGGFLTSEGDAGPSCAALVQLQSAWTAELRPY